ncbi:MAG: Tetratricopeptide repeat protein [Burkholderia sp.]|jgi:hypothetical protein
MSNQIPRAMLADIVLAISTGDYASALVMLGDEKGREDSAAVSACRALCAAEQGDRETAERCLRVALDLAERRLKGKAPGVPVPEAALPLLPPPLTPIVPSLEVVSPDMAALRLRRMLAALYRRFGMDTEAAMENALLPPSARV